MRKRVYPRLAVVAVSLCSAVAVGQSGSLRVSARVESSMLLVGIAPDGADFAQGGRASASAVLPLSTAGTQTFSVRALIANNPQSLTYQIAARLLPGSTANIVCDGVPLSTSDAVIAREVSYDAMQSHSIEVVGGDATAIVLTVRPN